MTLFISCLLQSLNVSICYRQCFTILVQRPFYCHYDLFIHSFICILYNLLMLNTMVQKFPRVLFTLLQTWPKKQFLKPSLISTLFSLKRSLRSLPCGVPVISTNITTARCITKESPSLPVILISPRRFFL